MNNNIPNEIINKYQTIISSITKNKVIIEPHFLQLLNQDCEGIILEVSVQHRNKLIAGFRLESMPGCLGICVSSDSYITKQNRNKGIGTILNQFRIELARALDYGMLICTSYALNEPQQKILEKNGWKEIDNFINPQTNHKVLIHTYHL